jgi:hypothetical protein
MAIEISRTFDLAHGAIVLEIKDQFGTISFHTIYVSGVSDMNATTTKILADTDAAAAIIRERMISAGWKP